MMNVMGRGVLAKCVRYSSDRGWNIRGSVNFEKSRNPEGNFWDEM